MNRDYWNCYYAYLNGNRPYKVGGNWWAWVRQSIYGNHVLMYMAGVELALFDKYGIGVGDDCTG